MTPARFAYCVVVCNRYVRHAWNACGSGDAMPWDDVRLTTTFHEDTPKVQNWVMSEVVAYADVRHEEATHPRKK